MKKVVVISVVLLIFALLFIFNLPIGITNELKTFNNTKNDGEHAAIELINNESSYDLEEKLNIENEKIANQGNQTISNIKDDVNLYYYGIGLFIIGAILFFVCRKIL